MLDKESKEITPRSRAGCEVSTIEEVNDFIAIVPVDSFFFNNGARIGVGADGDPFHLGLGGLD